MVAYLMIMGCNQWDDDLIKDIFTNRDVNWILAIPLQNKNTDSWYWHREKTGTILGIECLYYDSRRERSESNECKLVVLAKDVELESSSQDTKHYVEGINRLLTH